MHRHFINLLLSDHMSVFIDWKPIFTIGEILLAVVTCLQIHHVTLAGQALCPWLFSNCFVILMHIAVNLYVLASAGMCVCVCVCVCVGGGLLPETYSICVHLTGILESLVNWLSMKFCNKIILKESVLLEYDWSLCKQFSYPEASYHRIMDSSTPLLWRSQNLQQRKCLLFSLLTLYGLITDNIKLRT